MRSLVIVSLLFIAACAPQWVWFKPGGNPAQASSDEMECKYQARTATAGNPSWMAAGNWSSLEEICMSAKGYGKLPKNQAP